MINPDSNIGHYVVYRLLPTAGYVSIFFAVFFALAYFTCKCQDRSDRKKGGRKAQKQKQQQAIAQPSDQAPAGGSVISSEIENSEEWAQRGRSIGFEEMP